MGVPHVRATGGENRVLAEHAGLCPLDNPRISAVAREDLVEFARNTLMREAEGLRERARHARLHRGGYRLDNLHAVFVLYFASRRGLSKAILVPAEGKAQYCKSDNGSALVRVRPSIDHSGSDAGGCASAATFASGTFLA